MGALQWAPRLLAVVFSLFLAVFALDAFDGAKTFVEAFPDFAIHLIPTAILLGVVALAWRREWVGAVAFAGFAVAYAVQASSHASWIAAIAGPLLVIAVLYAWNAMHQRAGA